MDSAKSELAMPAVGEVFDAYASLRGLAKGQTKVAPSHDAGLGGWLVSVFDLDAAGIAALVAGAVAGSAVLAVDGQRERGKQLLRYGICDFVVNDLDEALRILKNEVRRKQPVSVCLSADSEASAREMVERGLQPEMMAGRNVLTAGPLRDRGAARLEAGTAPGELVTWKLRNEAAAWAAGPVLARVDELAAGALGEDVEETLWMRRWLQRAPRYMGRRLGAERCVRMRDAEARRMMVALHKDAALAAQVIVVRDGTPVEL